ncbi:MAG: hypothetical protein PHS34_09245 [Candidatus Omnitrophica bacterium]|jgi:hypothetical protein|nr:hypothetical protein [Candidatus Omnitrophota bacterium]
MAEQKQAKYYEITLELNVKPILEEGYASEITSYKQMIPVSNLVEDGQKTSQFLADKFIEFIKLQGEMMIPKIKVG